MDNISKELDLSISIDGKVICELNPKITQETIIKSVNDIKQQLLDNGVSQEKVFDVYDASIEILQNILKYSYGNNVDKDKKREADGQFIASYDSSNQTITIISSNNISSAQVETIKKRIDEVTGLDEKALKKLLREKMRSKRDGHADGAGLGFATIATKVIQPIEVTFKNISADIVQFTLKIKI
ncbi:MAG: SiaB family protein kinase [Campylobacterota bacterium]|nr:SiaB family protein kinase [Campylobacterota bacterium]